MYDAPVKVVFYRYFTERILKIPPKILVYFHRLQKFNIIKPLDAGPGFFQTPDPNPNPNHTTVGWKTLRVTRFTSKSQYLIRNDGFGKKC